MKNPCYACISQGIKPVNLAADRVPFNLFYWIILVPMLLSLTSCSTRQAGQLSSRVPPETLVEIADASDACPGMICPAGTRIFRKNGNLLGVVIEASTTMSFPSGATKPGMVIQKNGEQKTQFAVDAPAVKIWKYCIQR